ncbi:hypothetical protein PGIGA_G00203170 [Pangasianodon gigas]|uniref:Uncharacterized protein n=1 Tax=Pangasianodon gigas TaxID=30993 RepID=A0ACC5WEE1_PANGG|nr:hypothetical protein [Pangasianodon gigas]
MKLAHVLRAVLTPEPEKLKLDDLSALWNKDFLDEIYKPVHEDTGAALNKVISASTVELVNSVLEAMDMKLRL